MYDNIVKGNYLLPKNLDNVTKNLIRSILVVDPNLRPSISDVRFHEFY